MANYNLHNQLNQPPQPDTSLNIGGVANHNSMQMPPPLGPPPQFSQPPNNLPPGPPPQFSQPIGDFPPSPPFQPQVPMSTPSSNFQLPTVSHSSPQQFTLPQGTRQIQQINRAAPQVNPGQNQPFFPQRLPQMPIVPPPYELSPQYPPATPPSPQYIQSPAVCPPPMPPFPVAQAPSQEPVQYPLPPSAAPAGPQVLRIPCNSEKATQLLRGNIQQQIVSDFSVSKVNYNGTEFELEGSDFDSLSKAQQFLVSLISNSAVDVQWSWLTDNGEYTPYNETSSRLIETQYKQGQTEVGLNINGTRYVIVLTTPFSQRLPNSPISRSVRRTVAGETHKDDEQTAGDVMWYWKKGHGKFIPYTVEASRLIEQAYSNGQSSALIYGTSSNSYLIDFKSMVQLNEKTNYSRQIKRGTPN